MTILILNKRPLRATPYQEWIPDSRTNVVLFTAMANQTPAGIAAARERFRHVEVFDHYDTTGRIELEALALHAHSPLTAIVALSEVDLVRAAELRERLGLPGQSVASAVAFRDKFVMKKLAHGAGIPVAPMRAVASPLDLIGFMEATGYPVVVKPRTGAGTGGVAVLRDPADLRAYLAKGLMASFDGSVNLLAEGFVQGCMYHVDGLFSSGTVHASWPHLYANDGFTVMTEGKPLAGRGVAPDDPLRPRLQAFAAAVLAALPGPPTPTAFHLEVFLTNDGELVLCEVASRAGGNGINDMVREELGIDMCAVAARGQAGLATGPLPVAAEPRCLGGWMIVPPERGTFVAGPERCDLPFVTDYQLTGVPEKAYAPAPNSTANVASFVYTAGDAAELVRRESEVERWFKARAIWRTA